MTKSPRKNVPDVGIELGAACMPSELASDRATAPGFSGTERPTKLNFGPHMDSGLVHHEYSNQAAGAYLFLY